MLVKNKLSLPDFTKQVQTITDKKKIIWSDKDKKLVQRVYDEEVLGALDCAKLILLNHFSG